MRLHASYPRPNPVADRRSASFCTSYCRLDNLQAAGNSSARTTKESRHCSALFNNLKF
jgi:hypothetical protein